MDSIGIVGLSVREHDAAVLALWTLPRAQRAGRLPEIARALAVEELVYLATCNRVELLYRTAEGRPAEDRRAAAFQAVLGRRAEPGEAEATLRRLHGEEAVAHLFKVAAGLDSAQLGEREIRGQLREALAVAREAGTAGVLLVALIEEALRVARQVHARSGLGRGRRALADVALEPLLERVRRTPSPVALVGIGPVTRRAAEVLAREEVPFVVVNRTLAHAEAMVAELGAGSAMTLDQFRRRPPRVEAVLCATGAPQAVLPRAALERLAARTASQEPPLVVDLAIPPDVDPGQAADLQIPRLGIDEIAGVARARHEARGEEIRAAHGEIAEALGDLRRRLAERTLAPIVRAINARFRATALEGVERLVRKQGWSLNAAAREELERWAETLARRFAHLPTLGLRGLAAEHGMLAVQSFLDAGDAELFAAFAEIAAEIEGAPAPGRAGATGLRRRRSR